MSSAGEGTVSVKYAVDLSELQAGSEQAALAMQSSASEIAEGFGVATEAGEGFAAATAASSEALGGFAEAAKLAQTAFEPLLGMLTAGAVIHFGERLNDSAAEIFHNAEVLGLSTDAYQAFTKSAQDAGVDTENTRIAIMRFNNAQGEAQQGMKQQSEAFKQLGVDANLPAEQALPAVAAALLQITDHAMQSRIETELFGRSGQQLNPALEQWAEGIDKIIERLREQNRLLGTDTAKAAEEAKIAMNAMWDRVETAWAPEAKILTDAITSVGNAFNAFVNNPLFKLGEKILDQSTAQWEGSAGHMNFTDMATTPLESGDLQNKMPKFTAEDTEGVRKASQFMRELEQAAHAAAEAARQAGEELNRINTSNASTEQRLAELSLETKKEGLEQEVAEGRITKEQELQDLIAITQQEGAVKLQALNEEENNLKVGTAAFVEAENKKRVVAAETEAEIARLRMQAVRQEVEQETQKWTELSNAMVSSTGRAVQGMIFQHMTWQRAVFTTIEGVADSFIHLGEQMLENWIKTQIEQMIVSRTVGAAQAEAQIQTAAGVAGAWGTASYAGAPWPIDLGAPAFGAAMMGTAEGYSSMVGLDVGAWDIPHNMPAFLHKGEMVVPKDFASGMRGGDISNGGDTTFNNHYSPTINVNNANWAALLRDGGAEFVNSIQRSYRTGPPMRPSGRTAW